MRCTSPRTSRCRRSIFGDLIDDERFVDDYVWALGSLYEYGARSMLEQLLQDRTDEERSTDIR